MRRVSIIGLIGLVFTVAVGLAALRHADETWVGILLTLTLGLLGVATLGVIQLRDGERAWWLGFALFEGGYLVLAFGPWFAEHVQPKLATTRLLSGVHAHVASSSSDLGSLYGLRTEALNELNMHKMSKSHDDPSLVPFQKALDRLDARIAALQGSPARSFGVWGPQPPTPKPAPSNRWWQAALPGVKDHDPFLQVGHCLFALLAGLIGTVISCRFHARGDGSRAVPGPAA